ncbi:MAG TPA: YbhB/YbcL family Raf kinase inhibitor-like protein [Terriglobales bacterium]|nr:YbhB/YbcL family Raf kinase inhibitor-like protein [Terriglobales bacterium]
MKIESSSFVQGQSIPQKYTCDGEDASPELHWSNAPPQTKAFALIAEDPDAPVGTWVHWVIYNIPASTHTLAEGMQKNATTSAGFQGLNDFKKTGYGGPCPPSGKAHRYFFKLYALDTQTSLKPGATKRDLEAAMKGHIIASAELMGTYQRRTG